VVAPAVANAIFKAVGVRVRHMPITAEAVLEGIKSKKA
jgi:CO/xanthine dehydrogenase Mo-binding subunit